jgi:hypothetical protein
MSKRVLSVNSILSRVVHVVVLVLRWFFVCMIVS